MLKASTIRYDDCLKIGITELKKWGYLVPEQFKSGKIGWSINGVTTSSISIAVFTIEYTYILLNYRVNGVLINYQVNLVTKPSNLGKGLIWYFICPKTNKRCRKLYFGDTYFYHRTAYKGLYEKQTYSCKRRKINEFFTKMDSVDRVNKEINMRHFRKFYKGILTKKYQRLQNLIEWANDFHRKI